MCIRPHLELSLNQNFIPLIMANTISVFLIILRRSFIFLWFNTIISITISASFVLNSWLKNVVHTKNGKNGCPVDCLSQYVFRSYFWRNAENQSKLFIGLRKPHKEVSDSTIGLWVKDYLSLAGVNSLNFSAHSTREAASSKAESMGVPIDSILATASWSSQSTFARLYHRSLDTPTVAGAVFNFLERPVI
jgi:hypothetical protein